MAVHTVRCPECRASLKSRKPIPAGKLLTCPKCDVMFSAPAPVEEVEVVEDVEVIDDVEIVDDDAPPRKPAKMKARAEAAPVRKPARGVEVVEDDDDEDDLPRPRKQFKAKRKSAGGGKAAVIAVVAVLVLAIVGGGGALAWWLFGGKGEEPIAYLPPDAQMVFGVRLGALAREVPSLGEKLDGAMAMAPPAVKTDAGVQPRELFDYVCVGLSGSGTSMRPTIVATSSKPFDRSKMMKPTDGFTSATSQGQTYLKATSQGQLTALYAPNTRNLILTQLGEPDLAPVFRSDGKKPAVGGAAGALLAKVSSAHVWFVMSLEGAIRDQMMGNANPAAAMPGVKEGLEAMQQAKALAFWATIKSGMAECKVGFECGDASAAQQVLDKIKASSQGQGGLPPIPGLGGVKALADEITQSQKYEVEGTMAVVSFSFNVATFEGVMNDASKLAPLLGGFPGMGGPGAGGDQGGAPAGEPNQPGPAARPKPPRRG